MKTFRVAPVACLLALLGAFCASADLFEDFNDWPLQAGIGDVSQEGWFLNDGFVRSSGFGTSAPETPWIVNTVPQGYPDSSLRSPLMASGVGTVVFDTANNQGTLTEVYIHSSTNAAGPWTLEATVTNTAGAKIFTTWTNTVRLYEAGYIRFSKELTTPSASFLGIDNVYLYDSPAVIIFDPPYTEPATPKVGQATHVFCTIGTNALATISSTRLVYEIAGSYATNNMFNVSNDLYRTALPIPAQETAGVKVNYEIRVAFTGDGAESPASEFSSYTVAEDPFATDYSSLEVIGDAATSMAIVSNGLWRGVVNVAAPLTNGEFQFRGVHTNGTTTNVWGDVSPDSTALVAHGTAGRGEAAFSVDSMPSADYIFFFNEANGNYSVNDGVFNDFDNWTGAEAEGNHTSGGWVVNGGWISADAERRRGTRSCYLSADGGAYVRSPERMNGVGQISFWMRHWETDAAPGTECHVQVSETGGANMTEWTTIATIPVIAAVFNRYVIPYNNRHDRYVRILNTTGDPKARLVIDEFMVASAGAGVTLSGLTHSPDSPTFDESVSVSIQTATHRGANITAVTTYWRTGTAGGFTAQPMTQSGNTWTTVTDIPAGSGDGADGLGAGNVDYYVRVTYTGYESSVGSPAYSPRYGGNAPTNYVVQSAQLAYSNVVHTPTMPEVDTSFIVEADISPVGGATNLSAELLYRIGSSGEFTSLPMTNSGAHYVTAGSVPTPSHPGTPVQYYISTIFNGPSAPSPTPYPAGGASDPVTVVTRAATLASDYASMVVEGDFNGALRLHDDHQWVGVVTIGSTLNPAFRFKGTGSTTTNTWGDNTPIATTPPLFGTAVIGESDIVFSGTYSNDFIFHFNASNGQYRANACLHEDYNAFQLIGAPDNTPVSNAEGWTVTACTVFETGGVFEGRSVGIGGPETNGWRLASSPTQDGSGNISFWYRNLDETGLRPGTIDIDINPDGGGWQTIDTITNILSPDYLYYESPYASLADNTRTRLLWRHGINTNDAPLAIDKFTFEALGPYVVFSNLTHTPSSPNVADRVTIDVDITPHNHATGLSARVWYRPGTDGTFVSTDMIETTPGHFRSEPPIPRGAVGTMQYYVEATITDPLSKHTRHLYDPAGGASGPVSYFNADELAAATYIETSEGWTGAAVQQTNNTGWIANDGLFRTRTAGFGTIESLWLIHANELRTNAFLQTPHLTNGAGVIRFEARNKSIDSVVFDLQYSTSAVPDGTWQSFQMMTNLETDVWNWHTVHLNMEQPVHLRLYKTEHTGNGQWLGLDNIEVTLPLSRVAISNVSFAPLYPADSQSVSVSCEISSVSTTAPAMDITARVYYKRSTETNYTAQPIEMVPNGNRFVTSSGIPPYDAGDTVDYYIESTFEGYQSIVSNSPAFSPAGAPDSASHSYEVRAHESDFGRFEIVPLDTEAVDMQQIADGVWQGILYYASPATNTEFTLTGRDFDTGTNVIAGISYGDSENIRTNLPYAGQMQTNGANIAIYGTALDQYVLVYDERTGEYSLRRAMFQDFNTWPANDTYFDVSSGGARFNQFNTNFETPDGDWPRSTAYVTEEAFITPLDWNPTTNYPPRVPYEDLILGANNGIDFAVTKGLIIPQLQRGVGLDAAAMLHHEGVADSAVRMNAIYTAGAGTLEFDARCVNDEFAPATYGGAGSFTNVRITATMYASELPWTSDKDTCGECYVSILGRYVDENNYYELRMVQKRGITGNYYRKLQIWKCLNGTLNQLGADGNMGGAHITGSRTFSLLIFTMGNEVRLKAYDGSGERRSVLDSSPIASGGVGFSGMDAGIIAESIRVYHTNDENYNSNPVLHAEDFADGVAQGYDTHGAPWTIVNGRYRRPGYTGEPLEFKIDYTYDLPPSVTWNTLGTYTNFNSTPYVSFEHEIEQPENMFLRIRHTAGEGNMVVDNIRVNGWHGKSLTNDWITTAAWVAPNTYPVGGTAARSNVLELLNSRAYATEDQYLRSPYVSNGVATVEFDFVSMTGGSDELVFSIDRTIPGNTNFWVTDIQVTNNPSQWTHYAHTLSVSTNPYPMFVRIMNRSTDPDAGIALDNVVIVPPIDLSPHLWRGYNTLITGLQTDKLLVEPNNLKACYLNNGVDHDTLDGEVFDSDLPYIETAELLSGAGEVTFWYRAWDTNATRIDILSATNRFLPENQWTLLHSIEGITNQTYEYFSKGFYDPTARFVRLRCSTNEGVGRVCLDNLLVASPLAAGLSIRNIKLIPEVPLGLQEVFIEAEVYDEFLSPSNIALRTVYRVGDHDWGAYSLPGVKTNVMWRVNPTGNLYRTTIPFVAGGSFIDTVIQYYIEASFDGFLSEASSPVVHKEFTTPEYYYPVDLNAGQPHTTPYYIVLSCLPGQVWINEVNVEDFSDYTASQFIELCGVAGTGIGNWRVRILNTDYSTNATYTLPSSTTLPNATNEYGFYVLAKSGVPEAQTTLSTTLPSSGGAQLIRSMGAIAHGVCWDTDFFGNGRQMTNNPSYRLVYIGYEDSWEDYTLAATQSGSNSTDFAWVATAAPSSGSINPNQTLIPWPGGTNNPPAEGYGGALQIDSFSTTDTRITLAVSAETNGLTLASWSTTNLMTGPWVPGGNQVQADTGTTYSVACDLVPHSAFYKVTVEQ